MRHHVWVSEAISQESKEGRLVPTAMRTRNEVCAHEVNVLDHKREHGGLGPGCGDGDAVANVIRSHEQCVRRACSKV